MLAKQFTPFRRRFSAKLWQQLFGKKGNVISVAVWIRLQELAEKVRDNLVKVQLIAEYSRTFTLFSLNQLWCCSNVDITFLLKCSSRNQLQIALPRELGHVFVQDNIDYDIKINTVKIYITVVNFSRALWIKWIQITPPNQWKEILTPFSYSI